MTAFPVVLGICFDAEALWLSINPDYAARPVLLSHGHYAAREGLAPLLALLDRHAVKATFFVPGLTADRYPEQVLAIHRAGHEIGSHGATHRTPVGMTLAEERAELVGGIDAIARITGERPVTWRSPSWEWTEGTLGLLVEEGVTVSTNFHDAVRPYRHQRDGAPTPVVELPVHWHLADAPYFIHGGRMERILRSAGEIEGLWREEFSATYDWPGAFFHLTLHVQLIGHPGRLAMLDRLIGFMKAQRRTAFMTSCEVAATVA